MTAADLVIAQELQWQADALAVKGLDGLHDAGGLGMIEIDTLALRDRQRARIGPRHHDDGKADVVEAGDVGDARDAHRRQQWAQPFDRLARRDNAMGTAAMGFVDGTAETVLEA